MRGEAALDFQLVSPQVLQHLRLLILQPFLKHRSHRLQFGEVVRVNGPPVSLLHELVEAPEDLLFVRVVEEEQADDIVHALHVADLVVIISISLEHIIQLVIPTGTVFRP